MPRLSGVGSRLLIGGYDVSGHARAINGLQMSQSPIDVTAVSDVAMRRILARSDGALDWTSYFENTADHGGHIHRNPATWSDIWTSLVFGGRRGDHVANMRGLRVTYAPTIADDGSLTAAINAQSTVIRGAWPAVRWGRALDVTNAQDLTGTDSQTPRNTAYVDLGAAVPNVVEIGVVIHVTRLARAGGTPDLQLEFRHNASDVGAGTLIGARTAASLIGVVGAFAYEPHDGAAMTLDRYIRLTFLGNFHELTFTAAAFWRTSA